MAASAEKTPVARGTRRGTASSTTISAVDLRILAKLIPSAMIAWAIPEAGWDRWAGASVKVARRVAPGSYARHRGYAQDRLGSRVPDRDLDDITQRLLRNLRVEQLCFLRSYLPRGWKPQIQLEGEQHIVDAREAGRGAVLWIVPTIYSWLFAKRGLAEAGHGLHHLSRAGHGFTTRSRVGQRLLNPIRLRIEDRYLSERINIADGGSPQPALRRLSELLSQNAIVSVTVNMDGTKVVEAPLLGGIIRAASGAPRLAARARSALLPVVTIRERPGHYTVLVGPPLPSGSADLALNAMARFTEPLALRWPDQFCWHIRAFLRHPS